MSLLEDVINSASKTIENSKGNVERVTAFKAENGESYFTKAEAVLSNLDTDLNCAWERGGFKFKEDVDRLDINELESLVEMGRIAEQIMRQKEIIEENKV